MMLGPIHIKPDYEENGVVYVLLRDKSVPSYDGTWTPNTVETKPRRAEGVRACRYILSVHAARAEVLLDNNTIS